MPLLAAHRDNILLDEVLFDKIKAVYDRRGSLGLDAVQTRLVEKIYGKFVRAERCSIRSRRAVASN